MDVVGHFKSEEIKQMNQFQGGADLEKYGAPYFGKLWEIINGSPEIKEKISLGIKGLMNLPEEDAEQKLSIISSENQKVFGQIEGEVPPPQYPKEQELASKGEEGDTEVAFMPEEMMEFLWDLYPDEIPVEERVNEETGLPEFGFLDVFLPIVGGVIGTFILPGWGSAAGAALGSTTADVIHNFYEHDPEKKRSGWQMLGKALTSGALGYAGGAGIEGLAAGGLGAGGAALGSAATSIPVLAAAGAGGAALAYDDYLKSKKAEQSVAEKNENRINEYNDYMKTTREEEKRRVDEKNAEEKKYREIENARIQEHLKQLEANRREDIANEAAYQNQRNQQIKEYYAKYYPNISMDSIKAINNTRGVV
jgi:hypothetical protein